jgi:hypothetical protein
MTCSKHEGFAEEREWRIIHHPAFQRQGAQSPLKTSIESFGGIPQIIYKFPIDASFAPEVSDLDFAAMFDRLIIGPTPTPWAMYEAFTRALTAAGVANAGNRVIASGIPLRSY